MIKAIMAVDDKGGISKGSSMPWPKNSKDLQWFKKNTLNQVVVMGSKTWEDPFMPTPLNNRENILITSKDNSNYPGANKYLKGDIDKLNNTKMINGILVKDNLVNLIAKIGEKITIRRTNFFNNLNGMNFSYVH